MITSLVLAVGLSIVVFGILKFKLHAFVALILGGTSVAVLTPEVLINRSAQREAVIRSAQIDMNSQTVACSSKLEDFPQVGFLIVSDAGPETEMRAIGRVTLLRSESEKLTTYQYEWNDDSSPKVQSSDSVFVMSEESFEWAANLKSTSSMSRLTQAFGSYCGKLAILIVAASIIGTCLLESGAADRIVRTAITKFGEKNAPAAFMVSGFTLSIPVFFDTVFFLMVPLAKAMRLRTGKNYLLNILAAVAGGTMAHSLVPPTPGPLLIAEAFKVPLSSMIFGGCLVGLISSSVGMLYATWINRRCELELPEDSAANPPFEETRTVETNRAEADTTGFSEGKKCPPSFGLALLPIVLPVLLIAIGSFLAGKTEAQTLAGLPISDTLAGLIKSFAEKNVALMIAAAAATVIYLRAARPTAKCFQRMMQKAISCAGAIIMVTAAGGAFGRMMRQANVAELLEGLPNSSPILLVVTAFFVTTAVRTAQGSATVAMLTSAGIFGSLVTSGAAGVDPLYVALAVGCGSKPFTWMNDSGFLVITGMSGMTESEGLRYVTPMTAFAAFAGLASVIVGVIFFP